MSLRPIQLPINAPVGAGLELVSEDDPRLRRDPLVIVGSAAMSADAIYRKYTHYRIWHVLREAVIEYNSVPVEDGDGLDNLIQYLFQWCEDNEPNYAEGVDLVGIIYPKAEESKVTKWLSKFLSALPLVASYHRDDGSTYISNQHGQKSVQVHGRNGTKRISVVQQCLDIEVQESHVYTFVSSSSDPSWVVIAPELGPAMYSYASALPKWLTENEYSELSAWEKVKSWLKHVPISAKQEQQYPEGKNAFPDFRAWIGDQEYDIEMTSVPDLEKRTIRGKYRDLEKKICQVAAQPSETQKEVVDKLHEVVGNKVRRASTSTKRFMLVVSNWSTYELSDKALWPTRLFSEIDIALLIDINEVRCIKWGDWMNG